MNPTTYPPIFLSACTSGKVRVNRSFTDRFGLSSEEFGAETLLSRVHPEDHDSVANAIKLAEGGLTARIQIQQGQWLPFLLQFRRQDEVVVMARLCDDANLTIQSRSTSHIGNLNSLQDTLERMAVIVETKNLGMKCSILLIDWETERVFMGVGPSLPKEYNAAINGLKIGPMVGSCGTASYWNVPVIVENIAEDPLWVDLKETAALAGVCSCWSHPITATNGDVLGAMALYNDTPSKPEQHHMDGLEIASRMVGLAIERERLEEQIRHSTKMEAIGLLAGGIAHDFNNILVAILGNAELAMMSLSAVTKIDSPEGVEITEMLDSIVKASLNAAELCNQMLGFAGKQGSASESIDCNSLVREIGSLTQVAISKKVELSYQLEEAPLDIRGDKSQLGQVIMNLLTNASESIGDCEGQIEIQTKLRHYSQIALNALDAQTELSSGNYISLSISDTGCGMAQKTQARIFDPFFTTKVSGRGLGLAAVQGIIQVHGGMLILNSVVDVGTTFTVLLPQATLSEKSSPVMNSAVSIGSANILIIDDDEMVSDVLKKSLSWAGYNVLCAMDGQEGIDVYRENMNTIDCVLLDLSMPKLDGEEVFRKLCEIRPDVKVILCSGYAKQDVIDRFQGASLAGILKKPMQTRLLLEKIAEVVN